MTANIWSAYRMKPPAPRTGDGLVSARQIINAARLVMPAGSPRPDIKGHETTQERRRVIATFLREHGVPVPEFVPVEFGWADCYTGQLANPDNEPGANGRTYS